jgi:two-component system chemotaxis sensor kinase CheA
MSDSEYPSWQTRAEAAERTVAVLKRRLRAIDAGEEKTAIQRQLESAQRRAIEVDRRRALTELRSAELQRYSARLEAEVNARTEQIRTMLDHVASGFLLIASDLRVEPGWSKSCESLLGTDDVTGRSFQEILGWPEDRVTAFSLAVGQVFDDILPEDVTLWEVPKRASLRGRELALSYSVVRRAGTVEKLLATIVDVTPQIEAERAARHHERLVRILTHRDAFQLYVNDTRRLVRESGEADPQTDGAFIRRSVHTVKGNSATFGLDEISAVCHAVEDEAVFDRRALGRITEALRSFLETNCSVLGIDPDPERNASRAYMMTESLIGTLADKARSNDGSDMERFLTKLRERPANDFVEPIRAAVTRLSERLEKDVCFVVEGGNVAIDPVRLSPLLRTLPHLVRNAVDHGLEGAHERGAKPPRGTVALSFRDRGDAWEIALRDDGRGVDFARVLESALRRGLLTPEQAKGLSPDRALDVLSLEGFSTAEQVTDISGRGVGLSAVREAVETLGGTLALDSQPGRGSQFLIRIPKHHTALVG